MERSTVVLLVEDSEEDVQGFKDVFNRSGLAGALAVVHDGAEAILYLTGQFHSGDRKRFSMPTVMLLDLNLPKLNGWELLQWVRAHPEFRDLLVVVLTASVQ